MLIFAQPLAQGQQFGVKVAVLDPLSVEVRRTFAR